MCMNVKYKYNNKLSFYLLLWPRSKNRKVANKAKGKGGIGLVGCRVKVSPINYFFYLQTKLLLTFNELAFSCLPLLCCGVLYFVVDMIYFDMQDYNTPMNILLPFMYVVYLSIILNLIF